MVQPFTVKLMPAPNQSLKASWWWLRSKSEYEKFVDNFWSQSFELIRRSDKFKNEVFFHEVNGQTWRQLYFNQQRNFTMTYRDCITRIGGPQNVVVGPKCFTFDVRLKIEAVLRYLQDELERPTPKISGTGLSKRGKPYAASAIPKFSYTTLPEKTYVKREKDQPLWDGQLNGINIYLPQDNSSGACKDLTGPQIYSYIRNFLKDNPPKDLLTYYGQFNDKFKSVRRPEPRTIALGLATLDSCKNPNAKISDLASWLERTERGKNYFGLNAPQILKALYLSKAQVLRLISTVEA